MPADLTGQANHLGVTMEADIIQQKLPENNVGLWGWLERSGSQSPAAGCWLPSSVFLVVVVVVVIVVDHLLRVPARGIRSRVRQPSHKRDRRPEVVARSEATDNSPFSRWAGSLTAEPEARQATRQRSPGATRLATPTRVEPTESGHQALDHLAANGGYTALGFGKTHRKVYSELTTDHPIDLTRYQVINCFMGRAGLNNSGGASSGEDDMAMVVRTAAFNKRVDGMGLITGRKAFQRPMAKGVAALHADQDVYLSKDITIA